MEAAQVAHRVVWISIAMIKILNRVAVDVDVILKIMKRKTDRVAAVVPMILINS